MDGFYKSKKACEILNVHPRTLYQWEEKGWIETVRTVGGMRMYNVKKYLEDNNIVDNNKINVCYARVSTINQKEYLERQKKELISKYPNYELIEDIGSGMNLNKRGIQKIIDYAIEGKLNKVIVCYKDRLTRFGYDFIENLIKKYSNGSIEILNETLEELTDEQEMALDIVQVLNIYSAKINGKRKYKTNK